MKEVVFAILLAGFGTVCQAQYDDTAVEKKVKYGFNLGANYSNLTVPNGLPLNANISEGLAIRLGIISEININKNVSLSPKAELTFNRNQVTITHGDGSITSYQEMPFSLDIMAHFNVFKSDNDLNPYFFVGPNLKIPIEDKDAITTLPATKTNFAIDFGVGLNKTFTNFEFTPELRYSYGIVDVTRQSLLPSLYHHNISLVFNFLG